MQKVTVFLPDGESVTEKDMYYLYYHEGTGTFSLDYRNDEYNVTITSHDFVHTFVRNKEHVFSVAACNMSRIKSLPNYGTFIGNMLENPLSSHVANDVANDVD